MILVRAPMRIELFGGGTDLDLYLKMHEFGEVVNCTIDKFVYVTVNRRYDHDIVVAYSEVEHVAYANALKHVLTRRCLQEFGLKYGIEVHLIGEISTKGTGLGSSAAVTAALCLALEAISGCVLSELEKFKQVVRLEKSITPSAGYQDPAATIFGGLNRFRFSRDGALSIEAMDISLLQGMQAWFRLFDLRMNRSAEPILKTIRPEELHKIAALTNEGIATMHDPVAIGQVLDRIWQIKRQYASACPIPEIDNVYRQMKEQGAIGGNVCGAGGGGYFLVVAPPEVKLSIEGTGVSSGHTLEELPFRFVNDSCKIISCS